jgi:hypothetical protein
LKNTARTLGIYLASIERLGIDLELDLARLTKVDPLMTIFDVGGNFGQTTCRFASAFPDATIFTFEPEQFLKEGRIRFVYAECIFSPNAEMPHISFFDLNQVLEKAGFCFVNYYAESFNLRLGCAQGNVLYALRSKLPKYVQGT